MIGLMRDDGLHTFFFRSSSAAFLAFSSSVRGLGVAFAVTAFYESALVRHVRDRGDA